MKKFLIILMCNLLAGISFINAQSPCETVSGYAFGMEPQTGTSNYFGVRVSMAQTYPEDVTVTGTISEAGGSAVPNTFTLVIAAGSLTAETEATFYQTDPSTYAEVSISSVSPCPNDNVFTPFRKLSNNNTLSNQAMKDKIISMYFSTSNNINPNVEYNINNMQLLSFENTNIQGVYLEEIGFDIGSTNNNVIVIYTSGDAIGDMAMQMKVNYDYNGNRVGKVYDSENLTFATLTIRSDSIIIENNPNYISMQTDLHQSVQNKEKDFLVKGGPNVPVYDHLFKSWWDRWVDCGTSALNSLATGAGSYKRTAFVAGLVCAFAPGAQVACLGGFVIGCAAHATFT